MTARTGDRLVSILLIVFCIVLYFLIPFEIAVVPATVGMTARFFPYLTVLGILGVSVFLLFETFRTGDKAKDIELPKLSKSARIRVSSLICMFFAYIVFLYEFGYYISTTLALGAFIRYFGMKKWGIIVIFSCSITFIIYFIFYRLMGVVLPEGEIFR